MVDLSGEPRMQHQIQERRCRLLISISRARFLNLKSMLNRVKIVVESCYNLVWESQLLCNS
jgi:hypothetical protein